MEDYRYLVEALIDGQEASSIDRAKEIAKAETMFATLPPPAKLYVKDEARFKAGRCPRGAGKSYANVIQCLYHAETKPGFRYLVIGTSLRAIKQDYWQGAPGGFQMLDARFDIGLQFNYTDLRITHKNGSTGSLAGVDSAEDMERLRGSKVEADLIILDECQLHSPDRLRDLLDQVVLPGLDRRNGQLALTGTPGYVCLGEFYDATCDIARNVSGGLTCIPYALKDTPAYKDVENKGDLWSYHHWKQEDNHALPHLWQRSLAEKRRKGWADDHPIWLRERLGEWVNGSSGLVYKYAELRSKGLVNWIPNKTPSNPTGLPADLGPWHMLLGVDFGYEDDFALVVGAYSEVDGTLRHVWDWKSPHLTFDSMVEAIEDAESRFGPFEAIVADAAGLGKVLVETLMSRGIPINKADKREKFDFIELMNGDFHNGKIKLIEGSDLHHELCALQLDLSKETKEIQARKGKLKEDPNCANNLADAWLYLWRFSYHRYTKENEPRRAAPGSPEWYDERAREEKRRYIASQRNYTYASQNARINKHMRQDHSLTLKELEMGPQVKQAREKLGLN